MPKKRGTRFGLAAAGVAGLMAAGATAPSQAGDLKSKKDDCPQAAIGALRTIVGANTDYNAPARKKATKKKAAKKKTARKKTAAKRKIVKKARRKTAVKRPLRKTRKKAAKKAAKRRMPRRDPC